MEAIAALIQKEAAKLASGQTAKISDLESKCKRMGEERAELLKKVRAILAISLEAFARFLTRRNTHTDKRHEGKAQE